MGLKFKPARHVLTPPPALGTSRRRLSSFLSPKARLRRTRKKPTRKTTPNQTTKQSTTDCQSTFSQFERDGRDTEDDVAALLVGNRQGTIRRKKGWWVYLVRDKQKRLFFLTHLRGTSFYLAKLISCLFETRFSRFRELKFNSCKKNDQFVVDLNFAKNG